MYDETILSTLEKYMRDHNADSDSVSRIFDILPLIPADQIPRIENVSNNSNIIYYFRLLWKDKHNKQLKICW